MDDQRIPEALNPVDPNSYPVTAGGSADVNATIDGLQQQLAVTPPDSLAQQRYDYYKNFYQTNQPGQPSSEIERMALERAQADVDGHNAAETKKQAAIAAENAQYQKQNEMRAKLGLSLLDIPGQSNVPAAPASTPEQFANLPQAAQVAPQPNLANQPLPPEAQAYAAEFAKQQKANTAIATAESQKAVADEAAFKTAKAQIAASQSKLQQLHDNHEAEFKAKMNDLEDLSKELSVPENGKIDSTRLWTNMGTGQKVLAGIAMALGGYGGALSGKGGNTALDVINKAIERDIQEQKFNIEQKRQNIKDRINVGQNLLLNLRAKYSDDTQAELAMKTLSLENVQQQLNLNASKSQNPIVQQRANIINSQLEQQKQSTIMQLKQQMYQRSVLQAALGEGDPSKIPPAAMAALTPEERKIVDDRRERWVPGWGEALTKEGATKFKEQTAEARTALDGISEIKRLSQKLHALSPLTDRGTVEEIRTRLTSLIGNVNKSLNKTNRLSDTDVNLATKILGDPTSNTSLKSVQLKKLDTVGKILQNDVNNLADSHGVQRKVYSDFEKPVSFPTKPLK